MARQIKGKIFAIKTDISWGYEKSVEADGFYDILRYLAKMESDGAVILGVKEITSNGASRFGFRSDPYFQNWKKGYDFMKICVRYGFHPFNTNDQIFVFTNDVFGNKVTWFSIVPNIEKGFTININGDTGKLNIHFSETRPDLTAEQIVEFVAKINKTLGLKKNNKLSIPMLVDPEDWQEIAEIDDAFKDKRYK